MHSRVLILTSASALAFTLSLARTGGAQQQNGLAAAPAVNGSDSVTSAPVRRRDAGSASAPKPAPKQFDDPAGPHRDDPTDPRRTDGERSRIVLTPVRVSGKPGSLEVVGVPIPHALANVDSVHYRIVPVTGARVLGRTQGTIASHASRPVSLLVTVSPPTSAPAGRVLVASAEFDGPDGTQALEVPIEMTVAATHRVEVTVVDQLVGAHRGDVMTIRYRAVNFGNVADSVRLTAQLPTGWRISGGTTAIALPVRAARGGALRLWVPEQAAPGTSMIRVVANSGASVVTAIDVRVEVENPNAFGSQQGPKLRVGTAYSSIAGGASATAYVASLDGQITDSVSISASGSWHPANSPRASSSDFGLMRLGVPVAAPSLTLTAPNAHLGLGLTSGVLSDLTGAFVTGTGVSFGTRVGDWKVSGVEARPYLYGAVARDSVARGDLQGARIEHASDAGNVFVMATHLVNPNEMRRLDAASVGASFGPGPLDGLSTELGYRRAASTEGMGWSAELRRQNEDGAFSVRAMHAPGGAQAFARATDDLTAAASRRLTSWMTMNGGYWKSGDQSSTIGTSNGSGWNVGPMFALRSVSTSLSVQARGTALDVSGQTGRFGSSETQLATMVDVRRGLLFATGLGSFGQITRSLGSDEGSLPMLSGNSADLRASIGATLGSGTVQIDGSTQEYAGAAGIIPRRSSIAVRANHIEIPVTERMRFYAGAEVERMGFSLGGVSPVTTRLSLAAPIGFGMDITAIAERNPFMSMNGAGGWMTAIRIDHSRFLPRPIASGETHIVYHDLDGNGIRDNNEAGFGGLVVRCGSRTVITAADGRFKCESSEAAFVDPRSLPIGWLAPGIRADQRAARDIGLIAVTAVRVRLDLGDVDTIRVTRAELAKLIVVARDTSGQPWLARDLGGGSLVFDALPPGHYVVDVDASELQEPLKVRGRSEFAVGDGSSAEVRVTLTGRAMKVRTLPPSQGGAGSASDAAGKAADPRASRSSSTERK
jgi:hypothetical protein